VESGKLGGLEGLEGLGKSSGAPVFFLKTQRNTVVIYNSLHVPNL
jgi:hypothetical protein